MRGKTETLSVKQEIPLALQKLSSQRRGIKENKFQSNLFNEARSSGEVKENAASNGDIKESSSEVKPVKRESLNEDVKASKRID